MSVVEEVRRLAVDEVPPSDEIAAALAEAARLIREVGWVQGRAAKYGTLDRHGEVVAIGFCLLGALAEASVRFVPGALPRIGFGSTGEAISWNDFPGRTAEEVADRLEQGALA